MIHLLDKQTDTILAFLQKEITEAEHDEHLDLQETFDFAARVSDNTQFAKERNRVIIPAEDGSFREFIITRTELLAENIYVNCSASYIDLDKQRIINPVTWDGQTIKSAAGHILTGTEWQVGIVEFAGTRKVIIDEHMGAYQALKKLASLFGCEMRFRVVVNGNQIIGRYVDFFKKRGQFRGKEVVFGKDLIEIRRIEDSDNIVTALLCVGPEREDGTRLTTVVTDDDALQRWGRNGRHLWAVYEPETEDQDMTLERLTTLGKTELNKRINSLVKYETTQVALDSVAGLDHEKVFLADTIRIKDLHYTPPLYVEARAHNVRRSLLDESQKDYVLGDFIEYKEEDVRKRFKELQKIYGLRIIKSETPPEGKYGVLWLDTSGPVDVVYTWNGIEWIKATPTQAIEVGAETPEGAQEKATQAEQAAKVHADDKAQETKDYADQKDEAVKQEMNQYLSYEIQATEDRLLADIATKAGLDYVDGQLLSKVDNIDFQNALFNVNTELNTIDASVTNISGRVDSLTGQVNDIAVQTANLDIKADSIQQSVTSLSQTVDGQGTRLMSAEGNISTLAGEVALKATQTSVNSLTGRMSTAEGRINVLSDEIDLKVNKDGVISAINISPETIKLSANRIEFDGHVFGQNATFEGELRAASGTFSGSLTSRNLYVDGQDSPENSSQITLGHQVAYEYGVIDSYSWRNASGTIVDRLVLTIGAKMWSTYSRSIGKAKEIKLLADETLVGGDLNTSGDIYTRYITTSRVNLHGGIYSRFNTAHIFNDHNNGNVTISAAGGTLFLGYQNTTSVRVDKANLNMNNNHIENVNNIYALGDRVRIQSTGTNYFMGDGQVALQSMRTNGATLNVGSDGVGGRVWSADIYDRTYSSGADVVLTSTGTLGRLTSATKYKLHIKEVEKAKHERILELIPKTWYDKGASEAYSAALTQEKNGEEIDWNEVDIPYLDRIPGLIAEDVVAAGLPEYVIYGKKDNNGHREIEGLMYDRLWTLLIPIVREQTDEINWLKIENQYLKQKINLLEAKGA